MAKAKQARTKGGGAHTVFVRKNGRPAYATECTTKADAERVAAEARGAGLTVFVRPGGAGPAEQEDGR
jgi:hypothetical protein